MTTTPSVRSELDELMTKVKGYLPVVPQPFRPLTFWQWLDTLRYTIWMGVGLIALGGVSLALWLRAGGWWIFLMLGSAFVLALGTMNAVSRWRESRAQDASFHRHTVLAHELRISVRPCLLKAYRGDAASCQELLDATDPGSDAKSWINSELLTSFMRDAAAQLRRRILFERHLEQVNAQARELALRLARRASDIRRQIATKRQAASRLGGGISGYRVRQEWIQITLELSALIDEASQASAENPHLADYLPQDWPVASEAKKLLTEARQSLVDFVAQCAYDVTTPASNPEQHFRELEVLTGWCREVIQLCRQDAPSGALLRLPPDWNSIVARALQNPDPALYWLPAPSSDELRRFVAFTASHVQDDLADAATQEGHYVAMAVLALAILRHEPELRPVFARNVEALLWQYVVRRGAYPGTALQRLVWAATADAPSGA